MRRCKNTRRIAKGLTGLFAFSLMMANMTQAYAAEDKLAGMNDAFVDEVQPETAGEDALGELEEFFLSGGKDDSYTDIVIANPEAEIIMPLLDANVMKSEVWTIQPGTRYVSARISLTKGQHVAMSSLANPSSVTYWMGLMKDSNGDAKCVEGSSVLSKVFEVWADGKYRVFAQNRGNETIEVHITYYYY